jgi:hypothetical protein
MTVLNEKAMLARLKISRWGASVGDKAVSADVAARHNADPEMGRYSKRLVAKDKLDAIRQIATRARHYFYEQTLPWTDDGSRILPAARYFEVMTKFNGMVAEFEEAAEEFTENYPAIVDEAKKRLGSLFNESDYPSPSAIRGKFSISFDIEPMPPAEDFRVNLSDDENHRIRAAIEQRIGAQVEEAVKDIWVRAQDVVSRMSERLHGYDGKSVGSFRDTLVENVKAMAQSMETLNITGSNSLTVMSQRIIDDLGQIDAPTLRENKKLRDDVAKKADAILADISDFMS